MAQEGRKFLPTNVSASYGTAGGMPPGQSGWWMCPQCGFPYGCSHDCPTVRIAEGTGPPHVKQANPYELTLQRIAMALERIAAALDRD